MNRTLMLIAVLLLVGAAATFSVQPQWAKVRSADATSFVPTQSRFTHVSFKAKTKATTATTEKWVAAEGGGGRELVANRDNRAEWETFTVVPMGSDPDVFALRAFNGKFVCAEGGGGRELVANREQAGPWETFRLVRPWTNGRIAIQTSNGKYVSAESGILRADRNCPGEMESFYMEAW